MAFKKARIFSAALLTFASLGLSAFTPAVSAQDYNLPDARFEPDPTVPSWQSDTEYPAKLTWYVNFDWYAQPGWGVDVVTRKIKEDMNIEVEFIAGNDENLNTMMAGGDLPDIMTFDKNLTIATEAPLFAIPLNILAEKYDPYFLEEAAKPETINWYTLEDGNIYGYPSFSTTAADYEAGNIQADQVFIVRQDIYEAIGSPDMSTPEGFLQALRDAREYMPTSDDGTALVPFAGTALDMSNGGDGAFGGILQDFLSIPTTVDGQYYDRDSDEEYITWLETFRQAYNEGLMNSDQFSDNDNTMKEKMTQGRYFAYLHTNTKGLNEFMSTNTARNAEQTYIAIDGPKNSNGDDPTFNGGGIGGWTQTFITNDTQEPQKAMELITYLTSHYGTMVAAFGIEGETYNLVDGQVEYTEETEALRNSDIATFDKTVGLGSYWFTLDDNYAMSMGQVPATSIRQMVDFNNPYAAPRFELEDWDPKTGSEQRNLVQLNTARVQALAAFIQSGTAEEGRAVWDSYLASRENYGYSQIVEYRNNKIAENLQRLGDDYSIN
ncbi:type 2 periplasmic-binding domain-containing protein [Fundicoccus culcitae]|uniref:ABC transporter n=1 Tax=Fundicoccus culcitae TaxID=2969821 RepID=A0ABY5P5A7_9LACT|nr:ABC transporter [Fundicoccus culcitae]UUX33874.1 ABC transporter [Fundicoccus culcitae]